MQHYLFKLTLLTVVLHHSFIYAQSLDPKTQTLYAAGDIAQCNNKDPEISQAHATGKLLMGLLQKDPSAMVLTIGDNVYKDGTLTEFMTCYDKTWGSFKSRTYPSPGNHEYHTESASGYYQYFQDSAVQNATGYYSFNVNSWHIISLNSNLKNSEHQAQLNWLKADLEENKERCSFAYWHHPVFSSGEHGNNPQMLDAFKLLYQAKVSLVLNGHDHNYERFNKLDPDGNLELSNGIVEIVIGTGDAHLRPIAKPMANSVVFDSNNYGVLKLVLSSKNIEFSFIPLSGKLSDKGTVHCSL